MGNKRPKRRKQSRGNQGAFGADKKKRAAGADICPAPHLYGGSSDWRCMCKREIATDCRCTLQEVVNHHARCHITDECDTDGHPSIFKSLRPDDATIVGPRRRLWMIHRRR